MICTRQNLRHLFQGLLLFVITIVPVFAAKIAQIVIPKAIIYSDEALTSPLGHVSNGKLIPVAAPLEKNPDIVPVMISGRIAYVHIQDIRYVSDGDEELEKRRGAPKEHRIDDEFLTIEDKLTEHNHFSFGFGSVAAGEDAQNFFLNVDGVEKNTATRFYADFLHRNPHKRLSFGFGAEYFTISSSNAEISSLLINPQVAYSLIKFKKVNFEAYFAGNFGAGNTVRVDNNYANEPRGWFMGWEIGLRAMLPISASWSVTGNMGIKKLRGFDITNIEYGEGETTGSIDSFGGSTFGLGLSYQL